MPQVRPCTASSMTTRLGSHAGQRSEVFDPMVPNVARMYDFLLGGKDHYAADREAVARVLAAAPDAPLMASANRAFLGGAVRLLAGDAGISRFLDIGSGLPTRDNVHEVAQRVNPGADVVYVDHDPVVLAHSRALLATNEHTHACWGDLREPERILNAAGEYLDLDRPVAVLLVAVLHFLSDADDPYGVVWSLMDAVAPGSYLVISHGERTPELVEAGKVYERAAAQVTLRSRAEICRFFDGLDLVGRGVVRLPKWSPGGEVEGAGSGEVVSIYDDPVTREMPVFCGVGVKR